MSHEPEPEPGPSNASVARMTDREPAKASVVRMNEARKQANALMAWMERIVGASEGPSGADEVAKDKVGEMENH